jgi:hypothetical protein
VSRILRSIVSSVSKQRASASTKTNLSDRSTYGDFVINPYIAEEKSKEPTMTQRFLSTAALMLALLMSNASAAQTRNEGPWWGYRPPNRCMAWDGYQWLNMCWRSRTLVSPAWTRFRH